MKGVGIDIFGGNLRSVLGNLVSSTFFDKKKKKKISYVSFRVLTKLSGTVLFVLMKTVKLLSFLTIYVSRL